MATAVEVNLSLGFRVALASFAENSTGSFSSFDWSWNVTRGSVLKRQDELRVGRFRMVSILSTLVILGIIILATIVGNVFVMAAVVLERNLHNVANYLTASLAVADLLVAVLVMPLAAFQEVSSSWFLGAEVCDMFTSFDLVCCTSSILHLVAISLDRYWAVTRVDYIHNRSARRMLVMIAVSWGLSVVISIPPLFIQKDPSKKGECIINQDQGYTIFSTVGAFYLPFLLMMIIYLKVFRAARSSIRKKRFKEYVLRETPQTETAPHGGSPLTSSPFDGTNMASSTTVTMATNNSATGSPENSMHDEGGAGDAVVRNGRYLTVASQSCVTPPTSPRLIGHRSAPNLGGHLSTPTLGGHLRGSWLDLTKHCSMDRRKEASPRTKERRAKEKMEQKRERKAARTLAIITGSFIVCWLPFFIIAILRPFCADRCNFPPLLISVILWLGYFNSLLNPVIYTIFNPDFRMAFRKILFGKYHRPKYRRAMPILANQ